MRPSGRQRFTRRLIIATGISAFVMAVGWVIYLEFSQTESSRAEEVRILTTGQLPVEMVIERKILAPADTQMRDGLRYKTPRPLSETPVYQE
jgi:hypothetical protein